MLTAIGVFLVFFGMASILVGDKVLNIKGGVILKGFSSSPRMAKWRKWLIGIAAIYAGIMIICDALRSGL